MPPISSHTLRHMGCTRLGENNVNPKVMQYVMECWKSSGHPFSTDRSGAKNIQSQQSQQSQNLHKIISTHLLIMEVDFCPVLCILKVPVLQAFRGISYFVWYCKAVSDLS